MSSDCQSRVTYVLYVHCFIHSLTSVKLQYNHDCIKCSPPPVNHTAYVTTHLRAKKYISEEDNALNAVEEFAYPPCVYIGFLQLLCFHCHSQKKTGIKVKKRLRVIVNGGWCVFCLPHMCTRDMLQQTPRFKVFR